MRASILLFLLGCSVAAATDCSNCTLIVLGNNTMVSVWKNMHYREKYLDLVTHGMVDDRNKYAIVYFAWMFGAYHAKRYRAAFDLVPPRYHKNFLWMANSPTELALLRQTFPDSNVLYSPFNALLNEFTFVLPEAATPRNLTEPLCLINSQGQLWKNHALSKNIPRKVFVTYNVDPALNLSSLDPLEVLDSIDHIGLAAQLARADYGAILSTEEGNCRASHEYLMSGLPVLSTYSVGGREVFYDDDNSVLCAPTLEGVTEGHARMKQLLLRVNRTQIRERAMDKVVGFRNDLVDVVQGWLNRAGAYGSASDLLMRGVYDGRYAETFLNAWVETRLH